ncbi:molybdenum ABC transporter ATP-binding protein [Reinekea thalattae]|uniref:Molybdenum ABC transporter ATP-binding protein n=1 Tax=Reinekea thalattae TaxID=2593301 RepID=A0A5C8Z9Q1_9GAMM|nr:molybdenum ABC transporter ATP-binding protein [Reinekea thalattae]TXR54477.1 molybdenum ABC transporter ATP-binding protein [Reinekea thalattae]
MTQLECRFQVDRGDFCLDVELNLPSHGVSALFGHSGSGKTTCLRAMAGLERLPNSNFSVAGEVWQDEARGIFIPPHKRQIGYVFQEASLFSHLSVEQNLQFGLSRVAATSRTVNYDEVVSLLGIETMLKRFPAALSGGERQRVAIARALLTSPALLLMDEPLSALDANRKQDILPYLERLNQQLSIPVVYVSHAADEVARLADYLCILRQGSVIASGDIGEVLLAQKNNDLFIDGASSLLEGEVVGQSAKDGLTELELYHDQHRDVKTCLRITHRPFAIGSRQRCRVFASDVSLCLSKPTDSSILNIFPAKVLAIEPARLSAEMLVTTELASGQKILAQISRYSLNSLAIEINTELWIQLKSVAVL